MVDCAASQSVRTRVLQHRCHSHSVAPPETKAMPLRIEVNEPGPHGAIVTSLWRNLHGNVFGPAAARFGKSLGTGCNVLHIPRAKGTLAFWYLGDRLNEK